ncbi:MAG TPA: GvpL/GvpF family gas vesicle protein [Streptosporangiaceae bacterium]|nr:GvpL/GvpF family gas vesicle protein [Streptosporangiaceae bacterium]
MAPTLMTPDGLSAGLRPGLDEPRAGSAPETVVWVYAITDRPGPGWPGGLTGVGGEPVRPVSEAGLTAVVGTVAAQAFGEQALASLLGGLDNIERVGRAHHRVIAGTAAHGRPVLPLRLATVHPDDDTVRALLAWRRDAFTGMLDRFRDTVEWGVQIYGEAGPAGAVERAEELADAIDAALSDFAVDSRRQPAEDPRLIERAEWMVLNSAYLLRADHAAEFTAVAHTLTGARAGVRAEVNGPWPPYSFVDGLEA